MDILRGMTMSNAAGTCKTVADVKKLAASAVTEILVGSITRKKRLGNRGTNHHQASDGSSINSLGLPNSGLTYYTRHLPQMCEIAHEAEKRLGVSIAPFDLKEAELLVKMVTISKVDIIELNAGCPNVWAKGEQKKILSFNPEGLAKQLDILLQARTRSRHPLSLRVKLSPYSDPSLLEEVAALIGSLGSPKRPIAIVASNTFPNAFMFHDTGEKRQPSIPFGDHLGGFSGAPFRAIALGQVAQFRKHLPQHPIIGVGGISHGEHAWEYHQFDVTGFQVGSAYYYAENPRIFSDIASELFYCPQSNPPRKPPAY